MSVLHGRFYRKPKKQNIIDYSTSTEKKSKAHKCNYKENGIQRNAVFPPYRKLKQYKDLAQHKCSKRLNKVTFNKRNNFNKKEFFQNNVTAESPDGEGEIEGEKENEGENEVCAECGLENPEICDDLETKRTWKQVGSSVTFANDGFILHALE